ncbi:thiamine biosynthesis protein ThiS [Helicobacter sp. 13S00482-2]|uniref:sulfur carrier protein ThiS n=1 Tax=Helicobacter sp. 13S00482-2 TaxID=1476200 RepID=UPI000BA69764|nr:sulfur carrier protein ThiS [Helicobacter sp. 13S00482-2]PAF53944.1 thiamine biosynthesis protein ThiS [Helicobacter sp. 13S00482-2]
MKLIINGENKDFSQTLNIQQILDYLEIESKVVAVALNSLVVKKQDWNNTIPKDGDKLEFLQFMGGGGINAGFKSKKL